MRLQRVMTAGRWVPEIDGLRFIAIISVLFLHIFFQMVSHAPDSSTLMNAHRELYMRMGNLSRGVQLFFVISGFILARPFVGEYVDGGKPVSLRAYYKRRLTRLEPPYILALLIYALSLILIHKDRVRIVASGLLTSIFYVHNFISFIPIDPPAWTLEVEVQFYLIAPLLGLIYLVRPSMLRRALFVFLIIFTALFPHGWADRVGFYLPGQLCFFLIGNLLADLRIESNRSWKHWGWDAVGLISWPALFLLPNRGDGTLFCLVLFVCFCSALLGPVSRRVVSTRWIALIGGMCYSIYLTHMIVLWAAFGVTRHVGHSSFLFANYLIQLVLLLPPILGFGFVYYILIERPCMDQAWPSKLWAVITSNQHAEEAREALGET